MTLSQYVRRILNRWRLMALVVAAVLGAAVVLTLTAPVTYTARSQLYVASLSDQPDMESVQSAGLHAQGRMLSYAAVASSEAMANLVIEDLGLNLPPQAVAGKIRTEVPYGSVLINLTVTSSTAQEAYEIASSVASNYNELLETVEGARATELKVGVSTVNQPSLPASPSSPRTTLNLLAGLLAGLLLAVAVAAIRDLMDGRIRRDDDDLGAPVLGRLPRSGDDQTLPRGASTPLAEQARRLRVRLEATGHRTVLVAGVDKEGDAATVATLVGQSLAQSGRQVLVVEGDVRKPVLGERLGVPSTPGLTAVLQGDVGLDEATARTGDGLRLLPGGAAVDAPLELVDSAAMRDLLGEVAAGDALVLVTAPPVNAVADAPALARQLDAVLLVVREGRTSTRDLRQALTDLDHARVYLVISDARALSSAGSPV